MCLSRAFLSSLPARRARTRADRPRAGRYAPALVRSRARERHAAGKDHAMSTYTYTNRAGATHTAPAMLEPTDLPEDFRGAALARVEVDGVVLFDADRQAAMLATATATVATAPSAPAMPPPVVLRPGPAPSVAGPKGVSDFGRNDVFDTDAAARIAAQDAALRAHGIVADRTQQVAKSGTRMAASGYA